MKRSYLKAISLLAEYNSGKCYKRGYRVVHDGGVYRCSVDIDTPEAWNKKHWKAESYGKYAGLKKNDVVEHYINVELCPEDWDKWEGTKDQQNLNDEYPYRASIKCEGVTDKMIPYVFFSSEDAVSGLYAPVSESGENVIYIYAKKAPTGKICIPCVKCVEQKD